MPSPAEFVVAAAKLKAHVAAEPHTLVRMETNLTPVGGQFPSHDYLATFKLPRVQIAYEGSFNRSPWWATTTDLVDYNRRWPAAPEGTKEHPLYDPPDEAACRAIGNLLANPARFGGDAAQYCPLIIDIETAQSRFLATDTPAVRLVKVQQARNAIRWIREGAGNPKQEIYCYGEDFWDAPTTEPSKDVDAAMAAWKADLTAFCTFFYWSDALVEDPASWYGICLDMLTKMKPGDVVVINPIQNVYNKAAHPKVADKDGEPVPFADFCECVDLCVATKLTLVPWTGDVPVEPIKPHLAYVASHYHPNP